MALFKARHVALLLCVAVKRKSIVCSCLSTARSYDFHDRLTLLSRLSIRQCVPTCIFFRQKVPSSRGAMQNPPIARMVLHGEPTLTHQLFQISITEGVGERPRNTVKDHALLKMAPFERNRGHKVLS